MTTYFEDLEPGATIDLGATTVTEAEIVEFGRRYDPQPFHVDPDIGDASPFGGLIASGWHTSAVVMRLYVDAVLQDAVSLGSPGVDELRWLVPVRPGDRLRARLVVLEATPSTTKPGRGTIKMRLEALNQRDEVVLSMVARGLFARRG